jgi:hypothetical protein
MSQVEESLKSARLVHHMLIFVCATILAVSLSPSEEKDYSGAIAEIDAIRSINLKQFNNDSIQETNRLTDESEFAIDWAAGFGLLMRYELDRIGLDVNESDMSISVACAAFDEEQVKALNRTRLIRNYEDFIVKNIGIHFVDFGAARVAQAFAERLKDPNVLKPDFIPGTKLSFLLFNMTHPYFEPSGTRNFSSQMTLAFQFRELKRPPVEVTISAPKVWAVRTFEGTRFQDWLGKQKLLDGLIGNKLTDGHYYTAESFFPQLRSVWTLVADKVPEEAKRVLQAEEEKSQRKISFFSVEIPATMVVLAGPFLMMVLFTYLFSYLKHLHSIYKTNNDFLRTFPWLPLFPYRISRAVSFALLLLLPLVAFGWLLIKFRHLGEITLCTAILLTLASIVLAYLSWRHILTLRRICIEKRG